jgi:hypothetical protein
MTSPTKAQQAKFERTLKRVFDILDNESPDLETNLNIVTAVLRGVLLVAQQDHGAEFAEECVRVIQAPAMERS